jgi:hypothetical protein
MTEPKKVIMTYRGYSICEAYPGCASRHSPFQICSPFTDWGGFLEAEEHQEEETLEQCMDTIDVMISEMSLGYRETIEDVDLPKWRVGATK